MTTSDTNQAAIAPTKIQPNNTDIAILQNVERGKWTAFVRIVWVLVRAGVERPARCAERIRAGVPVIRAGVGRSFGQRLPFHRNGAGVEVDAF